MLQDSYEKFLKQEVDNSEKPFSKCVMGGTFDRLHAAHRLLLKTAAHLAREVFVGVVGEELGRRLFAKKRHGDKIQPYRVRKAKVEEYLSQFKARAIVDELKDPWGPAPYDEKADLIVVSEETYPAAEKINQMRKENGLKPLFIYTIQWVTDERGNKISSTMLREKETREQSQN
ncbi:MAG: pantetheine-phosphate adenylyltransferase [Methanobacteriota archaeon]|nr:MAG: pantetheine-phosphate adenylyltransferase [Euryarchaeota archaeon]